MYRTASYCKVREFEQLQVCVFEDSTQSRLVLRIVADFRNLLLKAFVLEPLTYQGHSFNVMSYELFLAQSFISEKNWRNRCRDYNSIVASV